MVTHYLAEAQAEIEAETGYPLLARWIADERQPYGFPLLTRWSKIIEAGVEATAAIAADAAVDHTTDPATVTVVTTVTDQDEIHVFYPASLTDETVEISPSNIDIDAGTAIIYIPRCRLVAPDYVDNPSTGLDYDDLTNFLSVVDVTRVYNDASTHATLVWPHSCTGTTCTCPTCSQYTQDACIYVADGSIGKLDVLPATYASATWTRCYALCCGVPEYVLLNYRAGLDPVTRQAADAIIHLAHAKMPKEPCTNTRLQTIFDRDQNVPEVVTRERINCKFGLSDGAWTAWQFASAMETWRARTL